MAAILRLDNRMRHRALILAAVLLLAACSTGSPSDGIVLTRQSRESDDWGRHLPMLYDGLSACLAAHPAQPAFATDLVPQNHGLILVHLQGSDGSRYECRTGTGGQPAPRLTSIVAQATHGPAFTPATMPEPHMRCGAPEPVLTRTGRLLGWLTYVDTDCPPVNAATETGWRAFGNEPYWSLRIAGGDIVFDRLGTMPQRYDARPASLGDNRRTWVLDAPDGNTRDRLEVVITETPCRDSMAGRPLLFAAEVIFRGRSYRGCAEKTVAIP
jgi:uncharacterized membrane protein